MRAFVTIEIGAKNEVLDPVYPLPSLPSWSKPLSYRKLPNINAPATVVSVLPWHYMMNLHSISVCKVDANSNKLFVLLEPQSSFRFQYQPLTMTTFIEIAVY